MTYFIWDHMEPHFSEPQAEIYNFQLRVDVLG